MSDAEGLALYYNNIAMNALAEERPVEAWQYLVRGLDVAPGLSHAVGEPRCHLPLRGQYHAAEQAYFRALDIDHRDRSAMNNLVVLYEAERIDERDYWLDQLAHYRDLNPYYHANSATRRWKTATGMRLRGTTPGARRLQPDDGELIYSQGLAAYRRGNRRRGRAADPQGDRQGRLHA
jgi:tetratricopeptide (TPR) repeat protein